MKWTRETVGAVNWGEKSTYEILAACAEHWDEICGVLAIGGNLEAEGVSVGALSCPACRRWGFVGNSCADCPLGPSMCCGDTYQRFNRERSYVTACAVREFIIHKRNECAIKPVEKPAVEPEYEWVDCTREFMKRGARSSIERPAYYVNDTMVDFPEYRMVNAFVESSKTYRFRIERRVEKKHVFKLGDKVKYEGREWTIVGFDGCTPRCARLERYHTDTTVVSQLKLEAVK